MSKDTHIILVLAGGLTARVENPYENADEYDIVGTHNWVSFNAANPPRPLTKYHEPGTKVRGREVWMGKDEGNAEWSVLDEKDVKLAQALHAYETRIAFEIIEEAAGEGNVTTQMSEQTKKVETQIVDRVRTQVEDMQDRVSEFFIKVAGDYNGNPFCEVKTYNQTDDRLSILKIDDRTVATVIETRTDFNHVEWVFSRLTQQSDPAFIAQVVEKALGYITGNTDGINQASEQEILALKDEIVNQIIKAIK